MDYISARLGKHGNDSLRWDNSFIASSFKDKCLDLKYIRIYGPNWGRKIREVELIG